MTGAVGLPEDPEEVPIETEGVGEASGSLPDTEGVENEPAAEPTDEDEAPVEGRS